jgi:hypothetical protein
MSALSLFPSFSYVDDAQPARTSVARDHFVHSPETNGWWGKESNLQFDQNACMYDNKGFQARTEASKSRIGSGEGLKASSHVPITTCAAKY